ncbi:MAG: YbhN family protein, partial [Bdellovibrionota bacterium]
KIATGLFFVLVVYLLVSKARTIEWSEVTAAITKMDPARLFVAGLLTAVGFAVYSLIDILSKVHIGHKVSNLKTAFAGFLSYAFNLNLGSLVGGIAFRFRIYSRFGLDSKTIGRIVGFSILSNWSGYVLLNG